ncbi:MAG: hypothetical protein MRY72_00600 [Aquisalinus sp.]|nr:hypothetical protein [Aquisalinus sp.]
MRLITFTALGMLIAGSVSAHEIVHRDHDHVHEKDCGHQAIAHDGHIDYLHDGHLHSAHGEHVDEHAIAVSEINPVSEVLVAQVNNHNHTHGADGEEHLIVQHGDHFDYIHDGRLHYVHGDHVDDHGPVTLVD